MQPDQDFSRPDICIGTDPFHAPPALRDRAVALAEAAGYSGAVDRPFSRALMPADHYQPDRQVLALMIKVNRALYMDEGSAGFDQVKQFLTEILDRLNCVVAADTRG